jgi:hypothetical protein
MSKFKVAAFAVALTGGIMAFASTDAQAQGYGHYGYGGGRHHYAPQPQYVNPRIARKQAQLERRFHEKFGYVQPQHGYGRQNYYGHNQGYYNQGYQHHQPRGYSYSFGW